jgi:succinate-semialdehyde dehydrogenase/glutarate-semialdehyde dehydrogenase
VTGLADRFATAAERLRDRWEDALALLATIETRRTAETELSWALNGLAGFGAQDEVLSGRTALGTAFVSSPATLPVYSFVLGAAAATYAGNRVVVRPSRHTAAPLLETLELIGLRSLPRLEWWVGDWTPFAARARVEADGVVFFGSYEHGAALCADLPDRVAFMFNGPGVCPLVVSPDADLAAAAEAAVRTRSFNSGQDCLATERVYVHDSVLGDFVDAVTSKVDRLVVGPNDDPRTDLGPLLQPTETTRAWGDVCGAPGVSRVVRPGGPTASGAWAMTLLLCRADSPVVCGEKYAPVLPVVAYRHQSELSAMIDQSPYRLGITHFTRAGRPPSRAFGHLAINASLYDFEDAHHPFGGYGRSSFVRRDGRMSQGPTLTTLVMSRSRR